MEIEVLRIGQRVVRDDRVTTHVALVSRALGASKIYMNEINPEIKTTLDKVKKTWGGDFEIEYFEKWKEIVKKKKVRGTKIVHLTMYGENINTITTELQKEKSLLIIVGAEKVPREAYELADYNISIGNQPHSEISALAVLLDRIQQGKQFEKKFSGAARIISPMKKGKKVEVVKTRD